MLQRRKSIAFLSVIKRLGGREEEDKEKGKEGEGKKN
jgi:hypothetical protein